MNVFTRSQESSHEPLSRSSPRSVVRGKSLAVSMILAFVFTTTTVAQDRISFRDQIAPLLVSKCQACHGDRVAKGEFRLDTYERLRDGGESGDAVIVPGKVAESYLAELIRTNDNELRMPKDAPPLAAEQIALIEKWIAQGAKFDGGSADLPLVEIMTPPVHPDAPSSYAQALPITALAFSPDGKELAVSGFREVTIWDVATGKLLRRIKNVAARTYALVYSTKLEPNVLAVGSGNPGELGEVRLFDPQSGQLVKVLSAFGDSVTDLKFSPDEKRLAAASADRTIRVFEMPSGERRNLIASHGDVVTSIAFSPDGKQLAAVGLDRAAKVHDLATNKAVANYTEHQAPVYCVTFSPDGQQVLSGGKEKNVHRWNVADGKKKDVLGGIDGEVLKLVPGGDQLFLAGSEKRVRQFIAADRKGVRTMDAMPDWIYALATHAPSNLVASGCFNGEVCVTDYKNGMQVSRFVAKP